jgi:hypothetical protein
MKTAARVRYLYATLVMVLLAGALAGCSAVDNVADGSRNAGGVSGSPTLGLPPDASVSEEYDTATQEVPASDGTKAEADRLIIRSKTMRLEVESTPDAVEALRDLAEAHQAVITGLQVATDTEDWLYRYDEYGYTVGDGAALRGWMTVRVPADELDAFVKEAIALGTVKYQAEDTEDVTQEHVDLSARLANLQAEEVRLRSFFDAANNVEEMLLIEAELNRVRQEIESLDAQVKYLERQAAMATVTIELTEERPVVRPEGESWGFREAITSGIRGAANVLTFAISFAIATAPLWIVGAIVFLIVRAILRSRRRRRAAQAQPVQTPEYPAEDTEK